MDLSRYSYDYETGRYELLFEEETEDSIYKLMIVFEEKWTNGIRKKPDIHDLGQIIGQCVNVYHHKEYANCLDHTYLHIPYETGRYLFLACFKYFVKCSGAPAKVIFVEHPGYPLTCIEYDWRLDETFSISKIIKKILDAIQNATIEVIEKEKMQPDHEDDDDLLDVEDAPIIEFDFEEELKQQMKKPVNTEYREIKGVSKYDD